jgi:NADPH:quinone reductase-like Zn-dependent oxidoreductase/acyl carrier protein
VILERPDRIDNLTISEADLPALKEREIRIAVRAFSLNFGDLLCVKGLYPTMPPYPFTPGFEASGVVLDVGPAVTAFQIGDPVIALAGASLGGQATVMTCLEENVIPKPAALSFEEACALPVAAITMIAAFEKARLKPGEKILIQTATGGTGLIAIQLANYYQAEIYATAGSQLKLDYLKQLGVPYRINYRETDFEEEIERLTGGQGVDVVINTLSGDAIQKGMNCLAPGGRYIEIAMTALKSARALDLSVLNQNQTFYSIDLRKFPQADPAILRHYCDEMLLLVEKGIITPTICQIFDWEKLKDAYHYMENRQHIGKIVVRIPQANQASQEIDPQPNSARHSIIASHEIGTRHQPGTVGTETVGTGLAPVRVPSHDERAIPGSAHELVSQLEEKLVRSLAQALYMEQSDIDVDKPFVDMGLDSIIGVEWIQSLNKQYASNWPATCVYDYPTIRQLARFLEKDMSEHRKTIQQTSVQPMSALSQDEILQQVQQGSLHIEEADQLLQQLFP